MSAVTLADIHAELLAQCWDAGGHLPWCQAHGVASAEVMDFLYGAEPSGAMLAALGFRRVVSFERVAA